MQRKLIKQGISGNTIYLPKKWVDARKINSGDYVQIDEVDDKLVLSSKTKSSNKEILIEITDESDVFIRNKLNPVYRMGYDSIRVKSRSKQKLLIAKKLVSLFLNGFEITNSSDGEFTAEVFSEAEETKISQIITRMFFIVKESMQEESDVKRLTKKITQYDNLCKRYLIKTNVGYGSNFMTWELLSQLNSLEHHLFHLKKGVIKKMQNIFAVMFEGYLKGDLKRVEEGQNNANDLFMKTNDYGFRSLYQLSIAIEGYIIAQNNN